MGEESVILTRDASNRMRVLLNTCRHRGMRVCRYDEGNTNAFQCPYHGWTYAHRWQTDRRAAISDRIYEPPFDKDRWGLIEAGQGRELQRHHLGDLGCGRAAVRGIPGRREIRARYRLLFMGRGRGWHRGAGQCPEMDHSRELENPWRNFAGDVLHNILHHSVDLVGVGPTTAAGAMPKNPNASRKLARCHSRSRAPDDHLRAAQGSRTAGRLSESARSQPIFSRLRGGAAATAGGQ